MTPEHEPRPWFRELKKFVGQDVKVVTDRGGRLEGRCVAIHFGTLAVVLMTAEHKVIVRGVQAISRLRTFGAGHQEGDNAA
jgi:hypothetical protein